MTDEKLFDLAREASAEWRDEDFHSRCPICEGTGKHDGDTCPDCEGDGWIEI